MKNIKEILKNYNPKRKKEKYDKNKIKKRKLANYRFQELMVECFEEFNVEKKWQPILWGIIGKWIKYKGEESVNYRLEKIKSTMKERNISSPRYFFAMMREFFKINLTKVK
jgi:hypothetical protein